MLCVELDEALAVQEVIPADDHVKTNGVVELYGIEYTSTNESLC